MEFCRNNRLIKVHQKKDRIKARKTRRRSHGKRKKFGLSFEVLSQHRESPGHIAAVVLRKEDAMEHKCGYCRGEGYRYVGGCPGGAYGEGVILPEKVICYCGGSGVLDSARWCDHNNRRVLTGSPVSGPLTWVCLDCGQKSY